MKRSLVLALTVLAACPVAAADLARYILPPGNGGIPFTVNSTDQLPLYSGLTPLRDNITPADIDQFFLPEDFTPIEPSHEEVTGRPGLQLIYDAYGIPHVYGTTRADVAFGAGWASAHDRGFYLPLFRSPGRAAVADVPNITPSALVGQAFTPSPEAEALVTQEAQLLVDTYGAKGQEILSDAQAYSDGINAYWAANNIQQPPWTVNDVIAAMALSGSTFGAGGGGEAANSNLLAKLQQSLGADKGHQAWVDVMLFDDPEAPTTIKRRFNYGPLTGGPVTGSVVLDPDSIQSIDPHQPPAAAAAAPARLQASNFLVVAPSRSASRHSLAVMGSQLDYYYPEIVQQIDLHGPGINAQGAAPIGAAMYILQGRTQNYAWSQTGAGHDVRDVYAEELCEPDASPPTRASTHYTFNGECRAMDTFNAGTLGATPLIYNVSVHGPMFATATVGGKPYALTRRRSTFGRDSLNLAALKDMTEGQAYSPNRFYHIANECGWTYNWVWVARKRTAYFSSGYLPERAPGLDRGLPTLGTGQYEWTGFLSEKKHPHATGGIQGLLLNWNNWSAPGFMHGDDDFNGGSMQRVEMLSRWPAKAQITDAVGIMNRAATQDFRSLVWPVVSRVLHKSAAPSPRDQQVVDILDDWVSRDAPRLDADADTFYDEAGPVIMDAVWRPIADAVMSPVFGALIPDLDNLRDLDLKVGPSYADKDLRTLLGEPVEGPFNLAYCGLGSLMPCVDSLWQAVHATADTLTMQQGQVDPSLWRKPALQAGFIPGLLPNKFPYTNRSTFQQVLEFERQAP